MPAGVFKESYEADMAIFRYPIHWAALILAAAAAVAAPFLIGKYYLNLLVVMMIFWIAAIGLNITLGLAGQISLAHAALMGIGAYTVANAALHLGVNSVVILPLAGVAAALLGIVLSLPSFRLKEYYLAMASLAAQLILEYVYSRIDPDQYTPVPPESKTLLGISLTDPTALYYLILAIAVVMALAAANIGRSSLGRAMKAVRDNDVAAEAIGINVQLVKATAFAIGGFYAGVAGGLYAIYSSGIGWEGFTLVNSIELLGMVLIGGPGRVVWGSLLGVLVMRTGWTMMESTITPFLVGLGLTVIASSAKYIVLGFLIVAFIIAEPEGLIAVLRRVKEYFRLWPYSY